MSLTEEINKWNNKKVLIIGEALIDKYIIGFADRISPDAPVPNIKIEDNYTYLGGIGLVLKFIKSLGGIPEISTIVGDDYEGNFFLKRIQDLGIDTSGIVIDKDINTPQVTRIKARNQHLLRLEKDYDANISSKIVEEYFERITTKSSDLDSILILDYGIGELFNDVFIQELLKQLKQTYPASIIARPNLDNYYLYEGIDMIKMNLHKALRMLSIECCTDTSISIVGKRVINTSQCKNLLINDIESDSFLFQKNEETFEKYPSYLEAPVRSYVAVGSVIMAILGLSYAAKLPLNNCVGLALHGGSLSAILPPVEFFNQNKLINYISSIKRG
jgi:rfaE bifunctional protein kinase chain/domain